MLSENIKYSFLVVASTWEVSQLLHSTALTVPPHILPTPFWLNSWLSFLQKRYRQVGRREFRELLNTLLQCYNTQLFIGGDGNREGRIDPYGENGCHVEKTGNFWSIASLRKVRE